MASVLLFLKKKEITYKKTKALRLLNCCSKTI